MSDGPDDATLDLVYDLDAPPQKVWRALSIPAFRERWLPGLTDPEPDAGSIIPGEELRYRLREDEAPFETSAVTFRISLNEAGGTRLRIIHERLGRGTRTMAANSNMMARARAA